MRHSPERRGVSIAIAAAILSTSGRVHAPATAFADSAAILRRLDRLEAFGATGAVAVVVGDSAVVLRGVGFADRERRTRIDASTPFKLGSLSKQITASAIIRLELDGTLRRTDRVERFFSDAPRDKRGITVEQLLTHTSGLPYLQGISFTEHMPRAELAHRVLALPLDFAPGARYAYSNYGYTLLALIVERVSGMSFEAFVRTRLLVPAGMTSTGFVGDSAPSASWMTHSYSDGADEGPLSDAWEGSTALGAGTIVTTLGDMVKWVRALRSGTVIPVAWRDTMMTGRVDAGRGLRYGYGWNAGATASGARVVLHDGDIGGYNAAARWYPDEDAWVLVLSNVRSASGGWRDPLVVGVRAVMTGATGTEPPARVRATAEAFRGLAGQYAFETGERFAIASADTTGVAFGLTSAATNVLAANPDALLGAVDSLDARSERVVRALTNGRADTALAALSPSIVRDRAADVYGRFATSLNARLGATAHVVVHGTFASSAGSGTSFVSAVNGSDTVSIAIAWRAGGVMSIRTADHPGAQFELAPTGPDSFALFDPFTSRRTDTRITSRDATGRVIGIAVGTHVATRLRS